jgi:hypothetical protein
MMFRGLLTVQAKVPETYRALVTLGAAGGAVLIGLIVVAVVAVPQVVSSQDGRRITDFDVEVTINPAGEVALVETITYDLGTEPGHGLIRNLPASGEISGYGRRHFGLRDVSAAGLDSPFPVHIDPAEDETTVRVGDFDGTPTLTGEHTFQISYTYSRLLIDRGDGPEYHADIVGSEWEVPIERTTVRVDLPRPAFEPSGGHRLTAWCYVGDGGERDDCDGAVGRTPTTADVPLIFTHGRIEPGQAMSVRFVIANPDSVAAGGGGG